MENLQNMLELITGRITASITYDSIKSLTRAVSKKEAVQEFLLKHNLTQTPNDFPRIYIESIVEFCKKEEEKTVIEFFRKIYVQSSFYKFYYGNENERKNLNTIQQRTENILNKIREHDEIIKHFKQKNQVDFEAAKDKIDLKIQQFHDIFRQKVQKSRTVKEAELVVMLESQDAKIDNITSIVEQLKQQGKESIEIEGKLHPIQSRITQQILQQFANKIINVEKIDKATFHIYGEQKIKKHLTQPPSLNQDFLGREIELDEIHTRLFEPDGHILLLVNGQGGIGKTSIAAQYYHRYQNKYSHVAWVLKEQSIAAALLLLAFPLGLRFDERMNTQQRLQRLITEMANLQKPCLLVIDNANDPNDLETHYDDLRSCENFHLLLTTRLEHHRSAATYKIKGLPKVDALKLFKKHYSDLPTEEEKLVLNIRDAVDKNTLVLEILAKNLHQSNRLKTQYSLSNLLEDLQQKGLLQLSQSREVQTDYGKLKKAKPEAIISAMYELGDLEDIESRLLSIFAVLPPENIPFERLESLLPEQEELDTQLLDLAQKGWLEYDKTNKTFKVSPVIQEIIKTKQQDSLYSDVEGLILVLIDKLDYQPGVGHLLNVSYEEAAVLARYGEGMIDGFKKPTFNLAWLFTRLGNFYQTIGDLNKAIYFFQKCSETFGQLHKANPDNSDFKNGLAISYYKLGQFHKDKKNDRTKARPYYQQCYTIWEELTNAYPAYVEFQRNFGIIKDVLDEL